MMRLPDHFQGLRQRPRTATAAICILLYLWSAIFVATAHTDIDGLDLRVMPSAQKTGGAASRSAAALSVQRPQPAEGPCLACLWDQATGGAQVSHSAPPSILKASTSTLIPALPVHHLFTYRTPSRAPPTV
ncbi:MAG TPA: hypothetical protein VFJ58_07675 [Armatimonadota bacterium]|nr:hypothetical protein [Armatimonadota bacterium]